MPNFSPIISVQNDGLTIPEVGPWAEQKYSLLGAYCDIFTSSMKNKWDKLIYLDLFAGAGYAKIKGSEKIIKTSSLISMSIPNQFNKYILSEMDNSKFNSLSERVRREYSNLDVCLFNGDTNQNIDSIISEIPKSSLEKGVLCFCFVDPFSINLDFTTIEKLARNRIDFLILFATGMDINRNKGIYFEGDDEKVERFLKNPNWRNDYKKVADKQTILDYFACKYDENMLHLKYVKPERKQQIRSLDKNLPLYHLAFYSKHKLGNEFWKKILRYGNNGQLDLF